MHWLERFEQERKIGSCVFLFVGAVGDGFPRYSHSGEKDPLDTLDPWALAIVHRLPKKQDDLMWVYDPAQGFRFPVSAHKDKMSEIIKGQQPQITSQNPIAQSARAAMATAANPLPSDALSAFEVMHSVFENTKASVAILPDIDAYITTNGLNRDADILALSLMRMAEQDAFKHCGHLILMSAGNLTSVPERLRRTESPVVVIEVLPPSESERRVFMDWLCQDTSELEHEREQIARAIQSQKQHLVQQARADLAKVEFDIKANHEQPCEKYEDNKSWLANRRLEEKLVRDQKKLEDEMQAYERAHTEARLADIKQLQLRLETDSLLQTRSVNRQTWMQLQVGDEIEFAAANHTSGKKTVLSRSDCGDVTLSILNDPTRPQFTKSNNLALYHWKNDMLVVRAQHDDVYTPVSANWPKDAIPKIFPLSRSLVERQLRELLDEPKEPTFEKTQLDEISTKLKGLLMARLTLENEIETGKEKRNSKLQTRKAELRRQLENPSGPELNKLFAELSRIDLELTNRKAKGGFPKPAIEIPTIARLTQALGYRDHVRLFAEAGANNHPLQITDVRDRRIALLRKSHNDLMDIIDPAYGFEGIAGLAKQKEYFRMVRDRMLAGDVGRVPMGAMFMGPPGTGKSALAEGFAKECEMLLLKLKSQRSMWVGETERNIERTERALRALAPVILFIDEIDEEDSGRDSYQGDSGVSGRLRKAMMQLLADPKIRGRIFIVSATNRPDRLDAALKRSGRTDDRMPILMPNNETRLALFDVMMKRYGFETAIHDFQPFAEATKGLSGADIEVIVARADRQSEGRSITADALHWAIKDFIPSASQYDIARMTLRAIAETSSRSYLPENVDEIREEAMKTMESHGRGHQSIQDVLIALFPQLANEPKQEDEN